MSAESAAAGVSWTSPAELMSLRTGMCLSLVVVACACAAAPINSRAPVRLSHRFILHLTAYGYGWVRLREEGDIAPYAAATRVHARCSDARLSARNSRLTSLLSVKQLSGATPA